MDFTTYELNGTDWQSCRVYHKLCGQSLGIVTNISKSMQVATQHNVNCPELIKERRGITSA